MYLLQMIKWKFKKKWRKSWCGGFSFVLCHGGVCEVLLHFFCRWMKRWGTLLSKPCAWTSLAFLLRAHVPAAQRCPLGSRATVPACMLFVLCLWQWALTQTCLLVVCFNILDAVIEEVRTPSTFCWLTIFWTSSHVLICWILIPGFCWEKNKRADLSLISF